MSKRWWHSRRYCDLGAHQNFHADIAVPYAGIYNLLSSSLNICVHQLSLLVYCFDESMRFTFPFVTHWLIQDFFKGGAKKEVFGVFHEAWMLQLENGQYCSKCVGSISSWVQIVPLKKRCALLALQGMIIWPLLNDPLLLLNPLLGGAPSRLRPVCGCGGGAE